MAFVILLGQGVSLVGGYSELQNLHQGDRPAVVASAATGMASANASVEYQRGTTADFDRQKLQLRIAILGWSFVQTRNRKWRRPPRGTPAKTWVRQTEISPIWCSGAKRRRRSWRSYRATRQRRPATRRSWTPKSALSATLPHS
jgi:hypothetical protein